MSEQQDLEPFEHWWILYRSGCGRMSHKDQCRSKFNKLSLEEQRQIYIHTKWCLENLEQWQHRDNQGKRRYQPMPTTYLNGKPWQDWEQPVAAPAVAQSGVDIQSELESIEGLLKYNPDDEKLLQQKAELERMQLLALQTGGQVTGVKIDEH